LTASLLDLWSLEHSEAFSEEERIQQKLLIELYNAIADRFDPPPEGEAAFWIEGISITDHPSGTSSTVPCLTSRFEYEAWHRVRFPGSFPVS